MTPELSVVIPTRDRCDVLRGTLDALALQTVSGATFEVIVVADGCRDATAANVRSFAPPFTLRVVEQAASGAAAARNRGADCAAAPILLFLDDDMEASPGLLEAHIASHRSHPGKVTLGYFRLPRDGGDVDIVGSHVDNWWGDRFSSMRMESHRFSFVDLFSGNVSLPRDLFFLSGGFDEHFQGRAGEDYELAVRLLKRGARFRFVPGASCIHHDKPTSHRVIERAYAEGRGLVLIASMHPETFPALPLLEAASGGPWIRIGPGLRIRPWVLSGLSKCLLPPLEAARRLKTRRIMRSLLGFLRYCAYWRGVLHELGSREELRRFTQDMPMKPADAAELDLDLETCLGRLETVLEESPAGAARLWYGGEPMGHVPSMPVSEPLRTEHVLHAVVHSHGTEFLAAYLDGKIVGSGSVAFRRPAETVGQGTGRGIPPASCRGTGERALKTFIAEYDLGRPVRALWGLQGYGDGIILVRKDGEPIDLLRLPHDPRRFALTGREIEQGIYGRLGISPAIRVSSGAYGEGPTEALPEISVVVCTRDRPRSLRRCLASLARLDPGPGEVIVVDNASRTEETGEIVSGTPFRYVREERPGLNWARNRGAREARFGIVAYVDDDVRVDPRWIRGIARGFRSPDVDAVTGLVLPAEMETRPQFLFEIYGGMGKGMEARRFHGASMSSRALIRAQDVGVGANMAFRRPLLETLGWFDTALDAGTPSCGGGDLDMFQRVLVSGGTLRYEPGAVVWHYHRRDFESLRRQMYCNGRSYGVYLIGNWKDGRIGRIPLSSFVLFEWLPWLVGRLGPGLFRRHRLPLRLLWAEIRGAVDSPRAYKKTYRHDRNIRSEFPM